jgi:hypothetical protein
MLVRNSIFSTKLLEPSKMREYIGNSPYEDLLLSFVEETCIVWPESTAEIFGLDRFFSVESNHSVLMGGFVSTDFEVNESITVDDGF